MNVLFVCTSNKDRSPALEQYFRDNYPQHTYRSAGVNKYFCGSGSNQHLLCHEDIILSNLIVFAEDIHKEVTEKVISLSWAGVNSIVLNCGEFNKEKKEDYLTKAELILRPILL